jgi:hypothetical protein
MYNKTYSSEFELTKKVKIIIKNLKFIREANIKEMELSGYEVVDGKLTGKILESTETGARRLGVDTTATLTEEEK